MSSAEIPIFPLGQVVLFPDATVPLHIFEPRYRQMTADALAGDRRIGMVGVRPESAQEMGGDPPLYPVGCEGFIEQHQELADGRYQILLRATSRFRIEAELPREGGRLYRVARVVELPEVMGDPAEIAKHRARVIAHLEEIARRAMSDSASEPFDTAPLAALTDEKFANGVAQSIALPPQEKQSLLAADSIESRLRQLESALSFHLTARSHSAPGGNETLH